MMWWFLHQFSFKKKTYLKVKRKKKKIEEEEEIIVVMNHPMDKTKAHRFRGSCLQHTQSKWPRNQELMSPRISIF